MGSTKIKTTTDIDPTKGKSAADKGGKKAAGASAKGGKAAKGKKVKKNKNVKRDVTKALVYINATFNNTLITVTDSKGEVIAWSSGGVIGYKGSRKSTPFAGAQAAKDAMEKAKRFGVREIEVYIKGPGAGKETAVKALGNAGVRILNLHDTTRFPHDGCRPKKRRR